MTQDPNAATLQKLNIKTHAKEVLMCQDLLTEMEKQLGPVDQCEHLNGYEVNVNDKLPPNVALFGGIPITIKLEPGKINMEPATLTIGGPS